MSTRAAAALASCALLLAAAPAFTQDAAPAYYELAIVDLTGRRYVQGMLPREAYAPRISPDGRRVVFDVLGEPGDASAGSVWIADLDDLGAGRELPSNGAANLFPVWSLDGESIYYISDETGEQALFSRPADGSGTPQRLVTARAPEAWTGGGATLSFITLKGDDYAAWTWSLEDRSEAPLIELPGSAQHSTYFSPDGRFVAYASNETGQFEVWVEPVPPTGERHRITTDGGAHPLWSTDGAEIYFDRNGRLFAVPVETADGFSFGAPRALPIEGFVQAPARRQFDLMPGGRGFLMLFPGTD